MYLFTVNFSKMEEMSESIMKSNVHIKAHLFCYHSVFDSSDFLITWLFLNSYLFIATLVTTQEIFSLLPIVMQGKMQETLSCSWSVWTAYIISFLKIKFLNLERHLREEVTCFSTSSNAKGFSFSLHSVFSLKHKYA